MATREIVWIGSSKEELKAFPEDVQRVMGYAPWLALVGDKHPAARPMRGFRGAGVLEVVDGFGADTYRLVYTLTLPEAIYVLHAFQKKSKRGTATPKHDLDLINRRLVRAIQWHAARLSAEQGDRR